MSLFGFNFNMTFMYRHFATIYVLHIWIIFHLPNKKSGNYEKNDDMKKTSTFPEMNQENWRVKSTSAEFQFKVLTSNQEEIYHKVNIIDNPRPKNVPVITSNVYLL